MSAVAPLQPALEAQLLSQVRALMAACEASHAQQKGRAAQLAHAYLALEGAAAALRKAEDARASIVEKVADTLAFAYEHNRSERRSTQDAQLAADQALTDALKGSPYSLTDLTWMAEEADPRDLVLFEFCVQMIKDRDADEADYKNGDYL